jgi:hypothetical protein
LWRLHKLTDVARLTTCRLAVIKALDAIGAFGMSTLTEKQAVYAADEAYHACEGDEISKMEAAPIASGLRRITSPES